MSMPWPNWTEQQWRDAPFPSRYTHVLKGGPGSGRYEKGSGGQHETGETVKLYRGDSKNLSPALDYSDPGALFGAGIYLTDNKRIAGDYKAKGKTEGVLYRWSGGPKGTKQEAVDSYVRQLAQYVDKTGKPLTYAERLHGFEGSGSAAWNAKVLEDKTRLRHALKQWKAIEKTTEVRKLADNTVVIQEKGQTGHLSEYDIPASWVAKTLDAEAEITEPVAAILHGILRKDNQGLADEIYHKATTGDEDGNKPSFREVYREAIQPFMMGGLDEDEGQRRLRRELKELGYKGIRYQGGITMGGATHNAYVFWDEQGLKKQRKKWDFGAVLDKLIGRGYALKGGPGSGRYPKGSGGHAVKPPPQEVLDSMQQPDGGFTYKPTTGEQPKVGFALSIHRDREQVVDAADANAVALAKYVVKNWDLLKLKGNYVGGWHNPDDGKVYLDVSTVVTTARQAESMARLANQLAYFDLVAGVSVKIVGNTHAKAAADTTSRWA